MNIVWWGDCKNRRYKGLSVKSRYEKTLQKPDFQGYFRNPQTIGEHIKKRRMDLGLLQEDAARMMHVSESCLSNWEVGRNIPYVSCLPAVIAFLGYYPFDHETVTLGGKLRRYKYEHGLSNRGLAEAFGVDESTAAQWVRNERLPLARSMERVHRLLKINTP
jgi:transcriptional regulator with XRE-family HTH domain